jgi:hypothetical protein
MMHTLDSPPSWPGLSRPSTTCFKKKDVDARHKAGHDDGEAERSNGSDHATNPA